MIVEFKQTEFKLSFSFIAISTLMLTITQSYIAVSSILVAVLHECGHLILMKAFGDKPKKVELGAFGMRIEKYAVSNLSYKKEAIISLGGVAVNFILCLIGLTLFYYTNKKEYFEFALVNVFIASLNLMPVQILDAGRFLKYMFLTKFSVDQTQLMLDKISMVTVVAFGIFCSIYTLKMGVNPSLICVFIYLLIINRKWR